MMMALDYKTLKKKFLFSLTLKRLFIIYQSVVYFHVGVCPSKEE